MQKRLQPIVVLSLITSCLTGGVLSGTSKTIAQPLSGSTLQNPSRANPVQISSTINRAINTGQPTYHFTISLPSRSAAPFTKVLLADQSLGRGGVPIQFDFPRIQAFLGTMPMQGSQVDVTTTIDETGMIELTFQQPIPAGTTVTLSLPTRQSPSPGMHEYAIAAYPDTPNSVGVYAGNGTLNIKH